MLLIAQYNQNICMVGVRCQVLNLTLGAKGEYVVHVHTADTTRILASDALQAVLGVSLLPMSLSLCLLIPLSTPIDGHFYVGDIASRGHS